MGLDMYAYAGKFTQDPDDPGAVIPAGEIKDGVKEEAREIFYWRKFNAFHGKMRELYESRGGKNIFNLIYIELTLEDLESLSKDIEDSNFTPEEGFFFGAQEVYPEDLESLETFIEKARRHLKDGEQIAYSSWR